MEIYAHFHLKILNFIEPYVAERGLSGNYPSSPQFALKGN